MNPSGSSNTNTIDQIKKLRDQITQLKESTDSSKKATSTAMESIKGTCNQLREKKPGKYGTLVAKYQLALLFLNAHQLAIEKFAYTFSAAPTYKEITEIKPSLSKDAKASLLTNLYKQQLQFEELRSQEYESISKILSELATAVETEYKINIANYLLSGFKKKATRPPTTPKGHNEDKIKKIEKTIIRLKQQLEKINPAILGDTIDVKFLQTKINPKATQVLTELTGEKLKIIQNLAHTGFTPHGDFSRRETDTSCIKLSYTTIENELCTIDIPQVCFSNEEQMKSFFHTNVKSENMTEQQVEFILPEKDSISPKKREGIAKALTQAKEYLKNKGYTVKITSPTPSANSSPTPPRRP